ncbi:MAG: hypothetical protein A2666_02980 [Parcubacteria group bacterium RIFCSPHIGHO2_01_FULL_47_10b]|nr:MAG: hypothetical protein A2666_02980 [Parcubacteria group bacterium RIFCSPHIGHO2_01_FULL_47_10b]
MNIDPIIKIMKLSNRLRAIERVVQIKGRASYENDAEHSYQLALVCWQIAEHLKLKVDLAKIFQYALAHDLVEVYAGDTPAFTASKEHIQSQHEREEQALIELKKDYKEFPEMIQAIENFEAEKDTESKLVRLLDTFIPTLNVSIDQGTFYKDHGITLEKYTEMRGGKIDGIDFKTAGLDDLLQALMSYFEEQKEELFAG